MQNENGASLSRLGQTEWSNSLNAYKYLKMNDLGVNGGEESIHQNYKMPFLRSCMAYFALAVIDFVHQTTFHF